MGWGDKYLDEIEFRTVIEINSRVLGLMNGDFHGTDGYLPQDQVKRLEASDNVNVQVEESMRIFYVILNHNREIMQDINFRKALSYAFDYDSFINDILGGSVARNPAPMPNNIWGNPTEEKGYTYDMDKAREYLAKVKKPIPEFVLGALAGYGQTGQAAALFQNSLTKLGLKTRIVEEPWSVVSKKMRDEQQMYDSLFIWKSTYYADPNNWIGELYSCDQIGARNNSWYCNPEVDALLNAARVEPDQAKRAVNYKKAAKLVMDDAGGIFVYNTVWFGPYNKDVKGVRFSPIGNAQEMRWVYFD
jgi:peptide/nickel transport system substrate-binding protein